MLLTRKNQKNCVLFPHAKKEETKSTVYSCTNCIYDDNDEHMTNLMTVMMKVIMMMMIKRIMNMMLMMMNMKVMIT